VASLHFGFKAPYLEAPFLPTFQYILMNTFEQLGLNAEIVSAVQSIGYETPTPIQEKTIPHLFNNTNDLIAFAQTGTGKTGVNMNGGAKRLQSGAFFYNAEIWQGTWSWFSNYIDDRT